MKYAMKLATVEGASYSFYGFKEIKDEKGFDIWSDTTTLYITLYEGGDDQSNVRGKGILKIAIGDFISQLQTMKAINGDTVKESMSVISKFGNCLQAQSGKHIFKLESFSTFG